MTQRKPDIGYIPTELDVVEAMLTLAGVNATDTLYDLGCGDGRIVIKAAQKFGIRAVGIDIDPVRIQEARENAQQAGVADQTEFRLQDLYESDFSEATIVTLYLLPHLNVKLRSRLFQQLRSGSRIISHDFDMGNWLPDTVIRLPTKAETTLYAWTIPKAVSHKTK